MRIVQFCMLFACLCVIGANIVHYNNVTVRTSSILLLVQILLMEYRIWTLR